MNEYFGFEKLSYQVNKECGSLQIKIKNKMKIEEKIRIITIDGSAK